MTTKQTSFEFKPSDFNHDTNSAKMLLDAVKQCGSGKLCFDFPGDPLFVTGRNTQKALFSVYEMARCLRNYQVKSVTVFKNRNNGVTLQALA